MPSWNTARRFGSPTARTIPLRVAVQDEQVGDRARTDPAQVDSFLADPVESDPRHVHAFLR